MGDMAIIMKTSVSLTSPGMLHKPANQLCTLKLSIE